MSLLALSGTNSVSGGYDIDNSVKLEDANNEWFYNASPTAGNRRTYTFSFWIKRTEIGLVNASGNAYVIGAGQHGRMFFGGDYFQFRFDDGHDCRNVSAQFRDTSAWYHFVVAVDTNQLSSSDRVKLYVNGESLAVDDHDGGSFPDLADQGAFFSTNYITIGTAPFGGSYNAGDGDYDMSGYLSEFCAIDGQQLDPTSFGEYDEDSGIWKPIDVSGLNFGSQGFYLDFSDAANLGDDASGNSNNFTENNITSADQATDTPTNNFATMTEAWAYASQLEVRWGGTLTTTNTAAWSGAKSTIGVNKGKWYWEIRWNDTISTYTGIQTQGEDNISASGSAAHARNTSLSIGAGSKYRTYINGTDTLFSSQPSGNISTGEVTGFALDLDSGTKTLKLIRSDSVVQTYTLTDSLATEYVFPFCSTYAQTLVWNLGGFFHYSLSSAQTDANGLGSFEFSPTIGGVNYYALCTKNLAEYG